MTRRDWVKYHDDHNLRFDIVSALWSMNLVHALEAIRSSLDPLTVTNCALVSTGWREIFGRVRRRSGGPRIGGFDVDGGGPVVMACDEKVIAVGLWSGWVKKSLQNYHHSLNYTMLSLACFVRPSFGDPAISGEGVCRSRDLGVPEQGLCGHGNRQRISKAVGQEHRGHDRFDTLPQVRIS